MFTSASFLGLVVFFFSRRSSYHLILREKYLQSRTDVCFALCCLGMVLFNYFM